MSKLGQKLIALSMILTFSISSTLPALSISSTTTQNSAPSSVQIVGNSNIKNGNKRLSVSLRDSNVKQALRMFADKAGLNIIFHESVENKTITLDLVGVTLSDALRMVMQASDLSYFVDGQTLIIMSAEKSKELNISKQNMMVLPVRYADATDVAEFLNKNIFTINKPGLSNTEIVAVNPARNELIIFGTQSDYDMAKKALAMIDVPIRVTNFKVKHVTPKEMAKNVCAALIKGYTEENATEDDDDDDSSSNSNNNNNNNNNNNSNSSGSSSGSGSKGQSSGLSAGKAGSQAVQLGKAKIACVSGNVEEKGQAQQGSGPASINKNGLKVMYFENLDTISVVGGSQDQIDTIAAYISANDVKQPMAYLELSIIELNEEGSKTFEAQWGLMSKNWSMTFNNSDNPGALAVGGGPLGDTFGPIYWAVPKRTDVTDYAGTITVSSFFTYLIENKKGKVLANPKVMVTSGKESKIDLSSDYIQKVETQMVSGTSTSVTRNPSIAKDQGIIISLTPFISRDGYVVMNIAPTYSVLKEQVGTGTDILATLLTRRDLTLSNIRVKDGDTLVIGGLIQEVESKTVAKIPLLGDIPGLGFFFRNTKTMKTKEELVILITPHIVKDSEDLVTTGDNNL